MINTTKAIIDFDYQDNEIKDINRCLTALYSTKEGEQPLDRSFGLNNDFVSYPLNVAMNLFALEITEKTELYEPRVFVNEVTYQTGDDGSLIPRISIGRRLT